jgi:hypothetical protein
MSRVENLLLISMVKVSFQTGFRVCGLQLVLYSRRKKMNFNGG